MPRGPPTIPRHDYALKRGECIARARYTRVPMAMRGVDLQPDTVSNTGLSPNQPDREARPAEGSSFGDSWIECRVGRGAASSSSLGVRLPDVPSSSDSNTRSEPSDRIGLVGRDCDRCDTQTSSRWRRAQGHRGGESRRCSSATTPWCGRIATAIGSYTGGRETMRRP